MNTGRLFGLVNIPQGLYFLQRSGDVVYGLLSYLRRLDSRAVTLCLGAGMYKHHLRLLSSRIQTLR